MVYLTDCWIEGFWSLWLQKHPKFVSVQPLSQTLALGFGKEEHSASKSQGLEPETRKRFKVTEVGA